MSIGEKTEDGRPADVTEGNWTELVEEGFEFLTNLSWPLDDDIMFLGRGERGQGDYVRDLYRQFGEENVKLGWPKNPTTGLPDLSFNAPSLIGVYAKRRR